MFNFQNMRVRGVSKDGSLPSRQSKSVLFDHRFNYHPLTDNPPLHSHRWHNVPVQIFTLHVSPCFDICKHWVISWLTPGGDPQSLEFEIHHTCIYHWRSIEKTPDPYAKNIVRCYLLEGVVIFVLVMLWLGASEFACVIGCDYIAGLLYNLIIYLY